MNRYLLLPILLFLLASSGPGLFAQKTVQGEPFSNTFSIVARDTVTGDIGVAVQSHWFSVGSVVSWAEAGVGAVATQSLVNTSYGPRGLELLKAGLTPQEALDELIEEDEGRAYRQVAIIDTQGRVAAYTGGKCIAEAGHITGPEFSVQANMMLNASVWPAMAEAFKTSEGPLAERMVAALQAAQEKGGDIRGEQSAAILVVKGEKTGRPWEDRKIELRVEDHPQAVKEIARLLKVHRAYEHMNRGDLAIERGNVDQALEEYGAAQKMFPDNMEMKYWTAVSLANVGKLARALPLFREVYEQDENWVELTRRIVPNGMLQVDKQTLERIVTVHR